MARASIFELLEKSNNLTQDYRRIRKLVESEPLFYIDAQIDSFFDSDEYTLMWYISQAGFDMWKNKSFCIDFNDYYESINMDQIILLAESNLEYFLTYLELIYNFWYIAKNNKVPNIEIEYYSNFTFLKTLMDNCLSKYNHKVVYIPEEEKALVVEDKSEVTAVVEVVQPELAVSILRYNHHNLKGDIETKKSILLSMYSDLEPKRTKLRSINKSLEENISYMMNNLNLRHNNTVPKNKNYNEVVAEMTKEEIENWYDEIYQTILLAFLELEQQERNSRIQELKIKINK